MPGNPLVRFDEGRVGRTARFPPSLLLYRLFFSGFWDKCSKRWRTEEEHVLRGHASIAPTPYSTGESFPSSARRTSFTGGTPCRRKASWNSCNVDFPPFIFL